MIEKLEEFYPEEEFVKFEMKKAKEFIQSKEIRFAAECINKVILNDSLKTKNEKKHFDVVEQTKSLGQELFKQ